MHYQRLKKAGTLDRRIRPAGAGTPHVDGYWAHDIGGRVVLAHVLVAERALGRRLPKGAQVHHVDENRLNNAPTNLVVCPDAAYHQLLHRRQRALAACGHADWLRCQICHQWGPPSEIRLYLPSRIKWHPACWSTKYGKGRQR